MKILQNCSLSSGRSTIGFLPPSHMPIKKTWRDFVPNIAITMSVVLIIGVLVVLLVQALDRPVANKSYSTHEIKSIDVGGKLLHPGDPGFEKAKKNASHNWVQ